LSSVVAGFSFKKLERREVRMVYRFNKVICIDSAKHEYDSKGGTRDIQIAFKVFYTFYIVIFLTFKIRLVKKLWQPRQRPIKLHLNRSVQENSTNRAEVR
jgi:hypothetical protein